MQRCEYKEGLSDETKNCGPLYLQSVYAGASKRSHSGGLSPAKIQRVTTRCNEYDDISTQE
jgi:hypothetical protein